MTFKHLERIFLNYNVRTIEENCSHIKESDIGIYVRVKLWLGSFQIEIYVFDRTERVLQNNRKSDPRKES